MDGNYSFPWVDQIVPGHWATWAIGQALRWQAPVAELEWNSSYTVRVTVEKANMFPAKLSGCFATSCKLRICPTIYLGSYYIPNICDPEIHIPKP